MTLTAKHKAITKRETPQGMSHKLVSINHAIVVEFVGPTGSGKTTNCQCFTELLKMHHFNVYEFKDVKNYFYGLPFYDRGHVYLRTIWAYSGNLLFYTLTLVRHGIVSVESIYRYLKLCVFNTALKKFIRDHKVDIILLDQWIIQGLWSATIFRTSTYDQLYQKLSRFYFNVDFVLYFDIDVVTASERIESRTSNRSRFDHMIQDTRLSELLKYNKYLFKLFENSRCKHKRILSTMNNPKKNANAFIHELEHFIMGNT